MIGFERKRGFDDFMNTSLIGIQGELDPKQTERLRKIKQAWNFYEGYHWEELPEQDTPELTMNYCRAFVDKFVAFELGKGFTFIGNQHVLEYNGKESRVDMLFFHRGLRCLVAIDLKIGKFVPEYAGKMNYYLSILDRTERQEGENPSIGIILCAEKDHVDVELALEGMTKPIGVADYQLIIPKEELEKTITAEIQSFQEERVSTKQQKEDEE